MRCHERVRREGTRARYFSRLPFSETPLTRRELLLYARAGHEMDCQTHPWPRGTFTRRNLFEEGGGYWTRGGEKLSVRSLSYDFPFQRVDLIFFHKQNDPIFSPFNLPEIPSSRWRRVGNRAEIYFNSSRSGVDEARSLSLFVNSLNSLMGVVVCHMYQYFPLLNPGIKKRGANVFEITFARFKWFCYIYVHK